MNELAFDEGRDEIILAQQEGSTAHFLLSTRPIRQAFLDGDHGLPTTPIRVQPSTAGFAATGDIIVGGETVSYTSLTETTFEDATGGNSVVDGKSSVTQSGGLTGISTLAGGLGEITGTGYARQTQVVPAPVNGEIEFLVEWDTEDEEDWPGDVRTIVWVTSADDSGVAIYAWHIDQDNDGATINMGAGNTVLQVSPVYQVANRGQL